jgi:hypothetical protein
MATLIRAKQIANEVLKAAVTVPSTVDQDFGGNSLLNLAAPVSPNDGVNKAYVDNLVQGFQNVITARLASTADLALSGLASIDGVTPVGGDVVFAKNQTNPIENGVYVAAAGAWTRSVDYAAGDNGAETFFFIEEGTQNGSTGWVNTNDPNAATIGTDPLTFAQFSAAGFVDAGDGLSKTGNTLSVDAADSSLTVGPSGVAVAYGTAGSVGTANAAGVAATAARSDHDHQVIALTESSGPTVLTIGAVANGEVLTRSGATIVGTTPAAGSEPNAGNKNIAALVTTADGDPATAAGGALAATPAGYVEVMLNGVQLVVQTAAGAPAGAEVVCYFSDDGGTTAKSMGPAGTIASGDILYWRGSVAGFELDTLDRLTFNFAS